MEMPIYLLERSPIPEDNKSECDPEAHTEWSGQASCRALRSSLQCALFPAGTSLRLHHTLIHSPSRDSPCLGRVRPMPSLRARSNSSYRLPAGHTAVLIQNRYAVNRFCARTIYPVNPSTEI